MPFQRTQGSVAGEARTTESLHSLIRMSFITLRNVIGSYIRAHVLLNLLNELGKKR